MDVREKLATGKTIYELPLKVCYYARVSTDHELQNTSIVNQVDYFIKYIKNNSNWQLTKGYIDEGISGKEVRKRPQFLQMIKDAKSGKFNLILTKSVSRFARNTIDSIHYTNILLNLGIGVTFLNDNINTFYPDSEFRLTLMASIAQDEIRKLSESVKFGLRQSIDRGIVLGSSNILGYTKQKGTLLIIKEEAQIIKDIFHLFITNHYNYSTLSQLINQKYQKKLDSTSIRRILTNPKYKGYYCGRKSTIIDYKKSLRKNIPKEQWITYKAPQKVPPIISEQIWEQAQVIIQQRKEKRNQAHNLTSHPYDQKIICGIHKKKLTPKVKKYKKTYYKYYTCKNCLNIKDTLLEKINRHNPIEKVYIYKTSNDLILKIKPIVSNYLNHDCTNN